MAEKQRTKHEGFAVLRAAKTFIDAHAGDLVAWHERLVVLEAISRREQLSDGDAVRCLDEVDAISARLEDSWRGFERDLASLPDAIARSTVTEDFRSSAALLRARLECTQFILLERSGNPNGAAAGVHRHGSRA